MNNEKNLQNLTIKNKTNMTVLSNHILINFTDFKNNLVSDEVVPLQ